MVEIIKSKVLKITELAEDVCNFKLSRPEGFEFKAGQFVMVMVGDKGRAYSVASSPDEKEYFDLCVKKVEGGLATTFLFNLKEGDLVTCKGPFGHFVPKEDEEELVLVGVGTGIAPLRGIAHYLLDKGFDKKIMIVQGARTKDLLLYDDELKALEKKYSNFSYERVLSRCDEEGCKRGYVQEVVKENISEKTSYFLCGLPVMVTQTKELLLEKGVDKTKIKTEAY